MRYCCFVDGGYSPLNETGYGSYAIYITNNGGEFDFSKPPFLFVNRCSLVCGGAKLTNNLAEVATLYLAISDLERLGAFDSRNCIEVFMDSELTIKHFYGEYRCKNTELRRYQQMIKTLLQKCRAQFALKWISGKDMKKTVLKH